MKLTNRDFAAKARGAAQGCGIFFFCGQDEAGASAAANELVSWLPEPGERVEMSGVELRGDPAKLGDSQLTEWVDSGWDLDQQRGALRGWAQRFLRDIASDRARAALPQPMREVCAAIDAEAAALQLPAAQRTALLGGYLALRVLNPLRPWPLGELHIRERVGSGFADRHKA